MSFIKITLISLIIIIVLFSIRLLLTFIFRNKKLVNNHSHTSYLVPHLLKTISLKKGSLSFLYKNDNEQLPFIKEFIFTKETNNNTLFVKYNNFDQGVDYLVYCYDKKLNISSIITVKEEVFKDTSNEIKLAKNIQAINIIPIDNKPLIKKSSFAKLKISYLLIDTTIFITLLFTILYLSLTIILGNSIDNYLFSANKIKLLITLIMAATLVLVIIQLKVNKNKYYIKEEAHEL